MPGWVEHWHKVGNNYADLLAKEACKIFDVVDSLAAPVIRRINDLKLIQKRLASIVCHLPNRPKVPRVPPAPRPLVSLEGHLEEEDEGPFKGAFKGPFRGGEIKKEIRNFGFLTFLWKN